MEACAGGTPQIPSEAKNPVPRIMSRAEKKRKEKERKFNIGLLPTWI